MTFTWESISDFLKDFGVGQGIFLILTIVVLIFLSKHFWNLYEETLNSKDNEIKRLVEENKKYREMFEQMIRDNLFLPKTSLQSDDDDKLTLKEFEKQKHTKS